MKLFSYYRSRRFWKLLPWLLLTLTATIILTIRSGIVPRLMGPKDFGSLTPDRLEGAYVTVDVAFDGSLYAQTERDGEVLSQEFIVSVQDNQKIALLVYNGDADSLQQGALTVTGTVVAMPEDSLEYYHAYLGYDELTKEQQAAVLPYYIQMNRFHGLSEFSCNLCLIAAGVSLVLFLVLFISLFGKGKTRKLSKQAKALSPGDPMQVLSYADLLFTQQPGPLRCDKNLTLYADAAQCFLLPTPEIRWAYCDRDSGDWCLCLRLADGQAKTLAMPLGKVNGALQALAAADCGIVIGYHPHLEAAYRTNPQDLSGAMNQLRAYGRVLRCGPSAIASN